MDINQLKNMLRVGRVSSVNGANCTARVTFPDKEGLVSAELPMLQIGSLSTKGYWVPEVDTQVLCAFLPNPSGKGINTGFILGAFYSTENPPPESDPAMVRMFGGCNMRRTPCLRLSRPFRGLLPLLTEKGGPTIARPLSMRNPAAGGN